MARWPTPQVESLAILSLSLSLSLILLQMVLPVVCLVVLLCNSYALVGSLNDEGLALLSFKQTITNKFSGNSLSNWSSSDVNPCSWEGITCQEGKVVTLSIAERKLQGHIHPALGTLSALRHINLRNNNLFGTLPVQLFDPKGIQSLVLSGNSLSGSIPSEIGKLRYLQNFDISHNSFNGSIPPSLLHCKRLKVLDLSRNNFTASLPDGFGTSLIALQKLNLSFNNFTGLIPPDIGNLLNLKQTLDLSYNLFTGLIPASLGSLPETVYIDLSFNNLTGPIPQNGALANRGPTAFIGNPLLCGSPLKVPCSSITPDLLFPYPAQNSGHNTGKSSSFSTVVVALIVTGALVGLGLIGFLFTSYYQNVCRHRKGENVGGCNSLKGLMGRNKEYFCFGGKDNSKTLAENGEPYDLVPLDLQVNFDLDELLKASAFVLGKSIFGIVYKVVLDNGPTLAVRRLGEEGFQRFKDFQMEVEAIGKIRHPNIVALKAYCWSPHEKLLIYDYIPNGDLASVLHGKAGRVLHTPLPWHVRLKIMKGIAAGLAHLHEFSPKKYVHGDLKPTNILLGPNMEALISDFGLARLFNVAGGSPTLECRQTMTFETPEQNSPFEFTAINSTMDARPYYQAPEAMKVPKPLQKWDVYSYGVILLEMVSGKSPMIQGGSSGKEFVRWIRLCVEEKVTLGNILDPFLVRYLGKEEEIVGVLKIALACADDSPEKRPSMRQVCDAFDKLATSADFCLY